MQKSIATHITALITAAFGFIALFHPGFTEPSWLQAEVPTIAAVLAVGIEAYDRLLKHSFALQSASIKAFADKQPPAVTTVTTTAPTATPAA